MAGTAGMSLVLASSAAGLTACSFTDDMVMGLGPQTETAAGQPGTELPDAGEPGVQSNSLVVTPRQRDYLEALRGAGVTPTSDLAALSIGSYVCQARAARQTDQQVWDFVMPMVRNDVGAAAGDRMGEMVPPVAQVRSTTSDYIRIATDQLC